MGRYEGAGDVMFCFWSLNEYVSLTTEFPDAIPFQTMGDYFLFADCAINLPAYAIRLTDDPQEARRWSQSCLILATILGTMRRTRSPASWRNTSPTVASR